VLVIHWNGGQHSELRVRKPRTGEHGRRPRCSLGNSQIRPLRQFKSSHSDQIRPVPLSPGSCVCILGQAANHVSRGRPPLSRSAAAAAFWTVGAAED
jgi:hypothetical protein